MLSIIGLTLVIRAALIPLFVKQIKSSRNMQLIQPKVRELQKKYGHDRERLAQETMKLYKESGTNPFASCLPIIVQMPIFLALFRLIDQAVEESRRAPGLMTEELNTSSRTRLPGRQDLRHLHDTGDNAVRLLAAVLVIAMTVTTFLTQRQLMSKNMPADALTGPYAQQQKMLLYVLPARVRGRWHRLPDRRALLLDHLEPVDDGPAVLRDPEQPGARAPRLQGQAGARQREGGAQGADAPSLSEDDSAERRRCRRTSPQSACSPSARPRRSARRRRSRRTTRLRQFPAAPGRDSDSSDQGDSPR